MNPPGTPSRMFCASLLLFERGKHVQECTPGYFNAHMPLCNKARSAPAPEKCSLPPRSSWDIPSGRLSWPLAFSTRHCAHRGQSLTSLTELIEFQVGVLFILVSLRPNTEPGVE